MSAMPLEIKAVMVVAVALAVARVFFVAPARNVHARLSRTLVGFAVILALLACDALVGGDAGLAAAFSFCGVEALFLAVWVGRRRDDEDGGGGGGGGGGGDNPPDPGPIDWDAFDRARSGWRPREPVA